MDLRDNPNYYHTDKPYKPKLICCDCRKVFKRRLTNNIKSETEENQNEMICPNCGKKATYVGPKFRAPKMDNTKAWKSLEILNGLGVLNFMGFSSNRIIIPESAKALKDLLTEMKSTSEIKIRRWVSSEFNEENKLPIKMFSDIVKKIDKYLKK